MKKTIILVLLTVCLQAYSQSGDSIVRFINPKSLHTPLGYSQAAVINLGSCRMVILSGQVPLDKQGTLIGKDDVSKQTEQVFINIRNAITEIGGSMENLVKLGYFLADGSDIQLVRETRNKFINTDNPPASTLVKVSHLFRDDVLIEIEATFIITNF